MRRDILELDFSIADKTHPEMVSLLDVDAIRLFLSGGSIIDWHHICFTNLDEVDQFLRTHLLDTFDSRDRERLRYVYNESVSYLEEHLGIQFPKSLRNPSDVREVFLLASPNNLDRRTRIRACTILKLMHVIQHMEAADLKFRNSLSEVTLFDWAHTQLNEAAQQMEVAGLPIHSFHGSHKTRSAVISKLLVKKGNVATTIFDKLRFRIVVGTQEDIIPVLGYLTQKVFPFNYVIPNESHNNLIEPSVLGQWEDIATSQKQNAPQSHNEPLKTEAARNEYSGSTFQMINFIVDYPVRLPDNTPQALGRELGRVVYVQVELQLVDAETHRSNEAGENAHYKYKERQFRTVRQRLFQEGLDGPKES